jgi:hypothetical protein
VRKHGFKPLFAAAKPEGQIAILSAENGAAATL